MSKLKPFKYIKKITIVYIHGFMGDDETFYDFPEFLKNTFELYRVKIINNPYPSFKTRGNFKQSVNKFIDWLYENGGSDPIILMGHSMGGILITEAYKIISYKQSRNKGNDKLNIIGLFGFDSPYFGLAVDSVANAGMKQIEEPLSSAVNYVTSYFGNNNNNNNNESENLKSDKENDIKNNSNESNDNKRDIEENIKSSNNNNSNNSNDDKINDSNNNSDKGNDKKDNNGNQYWNILGVASAVIAGLTVAYGAIVNKDVRESLMFNSQQILTEVSQFLIPYGKFLEPLLEKGNQYQNIDYLINNRVPFKNYYPITKIKDGKESFQATTFISLPSEEKYLKLFDSVPAAEDAANPIYSHVNMFNIRTNRENVFKLLEKCIQDIYDIIKCI